LGKVLAWNPWQRVNRGSSGPQIGGGDEYSAKEGWEDEKKKKWKNREAGDKRGGRTVAATSLGEDH